MRRASKISLILAAVLAGTVVLAALLLLAGAASLESERVRSALLERANRHLETSYGLTVELDHYALRPLSGALEARGLSVRAGASEPFLTADAVEAAWQPWSLVRLSPRITTLRLDSPRIDLDRLPSLEIEEKPPVDGKAPTEELPVSIERLTVTDASVSLSAIEGVFEDLRVSSLDARGRLVDGEVELEVETGRLEIEPAAPLAPLDLEIAAQLEGDLEGRWSVESLRLDGPPLELDARGSGSFSEGTLIGAAEIDLAASLPSLLALPGDATVDPEDLSPVRLTATADLGSRSIDFEIEGNDQPAALFERWLPPDLVQQLPLGETGLDLDATGRVALGAEAADHQADAAIAIAVRTPETRWADLRLRPGVADSKARVPFELLLLPASAGERKVTGTLETGSLEDREGWVESAALVNGRLDIDQPSLADLAKVLAPVLGSDPLAAVPASLTAGGVRAQGKFSGPLTDPRLEARVSWQAQAGAGRVRGSAGIDIEIEGRPLARTGRLVTRADRLEASVFSPDARGEIRWSGTFAADRGQLAGRLTLDGTALALGDDGPIVSALALAADLADGGLTWETRGEIEDSGPLRTFEASGALPRLTAPISSADASVQLTLAESPFRELELEARLAGGAVTIDLLPTRLGEGHMSAAATLPLATLAGVAGFEAIRDLPLERAEGPLALDWSTDNNDWTELIAGFLIPEGSALIPEGSALIPEGSALTPEGDALAPEGDADAFFLERLRGATTGSVRLDPAQPALASGRLEITDLEVHTGDLRATATQPLVAEIADGAVTFPRVLLNTDVGALTLEGRIDLDPGWSLGADPKSVVRDIDLRSTASAETGRVVDLLRSGDTDGTLEPSAARDAGATGGVDAEVTLSGPLDDLRGELTVRSAGIEWSTEGELPVETSGSLDARLSFDPTDLTSLAGVVEVPTLALTVAGRRSRIIAPLRIEVADGRVRLDRVELRGETGVFSLAGNARLEPGGESLLASAELDGGGTLDAALLNPWLAGGVANGPLELSLDVNIQPGGGDLVGRLSGDLRIAGEQAALFFASPYVTRVSRPEIRVEITGGRGVVDGTMRLNEGTLQLSGGTVGDGGFGGDLAVRTRLTGVRYRLDHGLLAKINGDLELARRQGLASVTGTVELDRGVLTRRMDLDLDFVSSLLAPVDLTTTQDDLASQISLDVELSTREGVWIKNNIGDLRARWEPLRITGTVAVPVIEGRIDVDPGGLLYAYGQTVRLDRAAIEYPGQAGIEPRLELETTTSFEDPTIGQLAGNDLLTAKGEVIVGKEDEELEDDQGDDPEGVGAPADATAGLATFWGEQIASRLSESLGGTKISIRPILIFGETDPGARLTLSRDVSPSFSLAASMDLRNAQRQTYLLDVHRLRALPQFNGQLFTSDLDERGVTARQTLELGGGRPKGDDARPRLDKLRFERPAGTTRRGFRRAVGIRKGDEIGEDEVFALEIEAAEYLGRRGYPDARVEAKIETIGKRGRKVAIDLRIDAGPRVEFLFTGEPPPRALAPTITALYRTDFYESTSIEEMKRQAVKVFRSRGHLDPRVEVEVMSPAPAESSFDRQVKIGIEPGIRVETVPPRFDGVSGEEAAFLTARFSSPVQRTELAMGLTEADRRLLDAMATLGYPEARIESRFQGRDDPRLTVVLRPGPRKRIADLRLEGVDDAEAARLLALTGLAAGDPARGDRLALAALLTEEELRREGRSAARVRVIASPRAADDLAVDVTLEVDPGPLHSIDEVRYSGLRSTRDSWASRVSGLEPGDLYRREDIAAARAELVSTGLFSNVAASVDPDAGLVEFDLEESSRFQFAYGLRWESSQEGSAVVDFTDRNLFGRSVTVGLRALYSTGDRSVRWLTSIPRPFGARGALELFARGREQVDGGIVTETIESSIQYSLPFGRSSTARVYARYRDIRLFEEDPDPFFPLDERIKTPLLGFQYIYDSRAGGGDPERGIFATVDLSGADEFLGGDFRFARLYGQVNLYRPTFLFRGRRAVWAQSYRVGFAEAFGGQGLPREHRFFAGGEYSVRGYELESLGPQETLGNFERPLGGRFLAILNQELRVPLFESFDSVFFLDSGRIQGSSDDLGPGREIDNPSGFFSSIGAGLRARTPIGLLRLDLAYPLDRRDFDRTTEIYLGFGNAF